MTNTVAGVGMADDLMRLAVTIDAGPDSDSQQIAELGKQLRPHILELDVEAGREATAPLGTWAGEHVVEGMRCGTPWTMADRPAVTRSAPRESTI
jgi:hypothetical protein